MIYLENKTYEYEDYKDFIKTLLEQEEDLEHISIILTRKIVNRLNIAINNEYRKFLNNSSKQEREKLDPYYKNALVIEYATYLEIDYKKLSNWFTTLNVLLDKNTSKEIKINRLLTDYDLELEEYYKDEIIENLEGLNNETDR